MLANRRVLSAKRIVIKVGSSSITGGNEHNLDKIVDFAVELLGLDREVILVSSGAIATAAPLIGLTAKAEDLPTSQALASIGQARLMGRYERSLSRHDKIPGQLLLTVDNLTEEVTSSNALRALERLIEIGVLPIINENDSVATQEIRFGDNDQLAARVSILAKADLLILLSDVDSLYTKPPTEPGAERIALVKFGEDLSGIEVSGTSTGYGTGGALTKLAAAKTATAAGISVLLTETDNVTKLSNSDCNHTYFEPAS
ncbi:glutamate 5-kinase [Candidatus Aquiluna sp. UB-MaderosW2red]|uniref:glutamate 5-kinase n=1 Tax=Candidatus Aquiluna sp. UB-MaderosW2red TaxID=1855377 RepID=UPI000875BC01|nr:glutamate 5-kinase [Candidatus Aquiluna sp. UB-MaderosW2red]